MESAELAEIEIQALERLNDAQRRIAGELAKVVVGQHRVIEEILIAMFAGGHALLVGVPGLAKTLTVRTIADSLALKFRRVQFTPDLMPSDIVGTEVIHENRETGERGFRFMPGPIFANLVLADEINRTPPKTQAALLEAMQERHVTVAGVRHDLDDPFFVLATQNPIEQEGTYPLPEAQLDRFMLQIQVDYPSEEEELRIALETTSGETRAVTPVLHGSDIVELRRIVRRMPVSPRTAQFAVRLARMSRPTEPGADEFVKKYVLWGAGPRASQYLLLGAKARAALKGSRHVRLEDVQAVAAPALRHRIRTNFHADAEGVGVEAVIERLLQIASAAPSRDDHVAEVFRPADARANP